jgi:hypothetical protein
LENDLQRDGLQPDQTCENCVHTFRKSKRQDVVVCVPHLKTMPANNSLVCELYKAKNISNASRSNNEGLR